MAAGKDHTEAAKLLIEKGALIDFNTAKQLWSTPSIKSSNLLKKYIYQNRYSVSFSVAVSALAISQFLALQSIDQTDETPSYTPPS